MDGTSFDRITRALAEGRSRRSVVKALAGGFAGGALGIFGGTVGAAGRCRPVGQACKTSEDCCPGPNRNGNVFCGSTGGKSKACQACPSTASTACNGGCVNTTNDNANCGACGKTCGGGSSCVGSVCLCPGGKTLCNGVCVDTLGDNNNCGACGHVCAAGTNCCGGACGSGEGAACTGPADCCGSICTQSNSNHQLCCASGKACFDNPTLGPECCQNAGAQCYAAGCCETGEACGDDTCCAAGETCTTDNDGTQLCCASGKACFAFTTSVCCANADASCFTAGCCETGKSCGTPGLHLCCAANETCNPSTSECEPIA